MHIEVTIQSGGKRLNAESSESNMNNPLFTVITVVFNGAKELESTIQSVQNQSCRNLEYVVIDGGSTDGTLDVLRRYENLIGYWMSGLDKGVYDAFNKACRLIKGEWAIFLGAGDVFYDAEVLESMTEAVQNVSAETEIVYGKVCVVNEQNSSSELLNWPWPQMRDTWQGGRPMVPHHQGVFHRKRLLSMESPFDISYRIAADSKLFYTSISRVDPAFADVVVARSLLGGLSTEPKYYIDNLNEIVRINSEFGFVNQPHLLWFYLKSVVKYSIFKAGNDRLAKRFVDIYRQLTGRKPKWIL